MRGRKIERVKARNSVLWTFERRQVTFKRRTEASFQILKSAVVAVQGKAERELRHTLQAIEKWAIQSSSAAQRG